ncbi:hypothetical protein BJI49_14015 [Acetobacter pasteurianus]|uniref:hypothetical protein n=1 Tax=Acetobacter pasteurianus TaxID=438 RepID=UPI0002458288|nr:hypothetical protein [Acetobacter pasteurianus]RCL04236.1 hypothetical protein BJI49_14015 [Acetobacter pasteurianus]GAB32123.1 hypothetical protein APS_2725 [Acetobacter pasteurianus subsp. pasteurianus LMG 1262 = NBRC 106471]GCD50344.1 hypothetical protein NBRC106471_1900 [Acetobacter pasteurianus subsp. pasteurianus LMG 1262 = NBRC 106471]
MADLIRPHIQDFARDDLPSLKMVRSMPSEYRGVFENLRDALKEARSCVFRSGQYVLTDAEIAVQAWLHQDVLARVLPQLIQRGFLARDDEGALFSPHLYDRLLRKEEREAAKAEADARWQQMQESCDVPEGISRKAMAARENGKKGGRPRKSPVMNTTQRSMPLMSTVDGGKGAAENPSKKPITGLGYETSVPSVSIDLELERDNNIPSSSISGETENPALAQEQVAQTVARVIATTGMNDQAPYAVSLVRRWMGQGAEPDTIISAIREHTEAMRKNGEEPRRLKVFEAAVLRGIEVQHLRPKVQDTAPEKPQTVKENAKFEQAWAKAAKVWKDAFTDCRDFGAVKRRWPELAQENGLPPVPFEKTAYQQHFMHQQSAQVAA